MSKNTHWKKLTNPDYLGAYDFEEGEERSLTIKNVKKTEVIGPGGIKDECIVAYMSEGKPMVLNATNCKAIEFMYSTPYIEQWSGLEIKVHVEKVKYRGDMVDGLRIINEGKKTRAKSTKIILKKDDSNWSKVVKHIKTQKGKDVPFEKIKAQLSNKYQMSATMVSNLKKMYTES